MARICVAVKFKSLASWPKLRDAVDWSFVAFSPADNFVG